MNSTFKILRDDSIPAFGGWKRGGMKCGEPVEMEPQDYKQVMIGTLMHEFGHALQEFFDLEFDEARIEEIVDSYYGMRPIDEETA